MRIAIISACPVKAPSDFYSPLSEVCCTSFSFILETFRKSQNWEPSLIIPSDGFHFEVLEGDFKVYRAPLTLSNKNQYLRKLKLWLKSFISRLKHPDLIERNYRFRGYRQEALRRADADVYMVHGLNNLAAEVALFCKLHNRKNILVLSKNSELNSSVYIESDEIGSDGTVGHLANYAIESADVIIAGSLYQSHKCAEVFKRQAELIIPALEVDETAKSFSGSDRGNFVLWVGRANHIDRPNLLLQVASKLPNIPFVAAMNSDIHAFKEFILKNAIPNIEFFEDASPHELDQLYRECGLICDTSLSDGYPSSLLQACRFSAPIACLEACKHSEIAEYDLGVAAAGDIEDLAAGIACLLESADSRSKVSSNIFVYAEAHHAPQVLSAKILEIAEMAYNID